jgi:uncharacterized protein YndB with AHSA1/START domain
MDMDRIEREIAIDAPIEVVWSVVTEPEHMRIWFCDTVEVDVRPGREGRLSWVEKARHRLTTTNVRIERLEPPHFFSFRWDYPDGSDPDPTNAPLVEFTLEDEGNSTRLHVVESGLDSVQRSDEIRERYFDEHSSGWVVILERLRDYAVEQSGKVAV